MLKALFSSRKFVVVLLGMGGVTALAAFGKIGGHEVADVLKWCVSAYAIGTGIESMGLGPSAASKGPQS